MWSFWSYAPETVPLRAAAAFALALVVSLLTGGRRIAFLKGHERGGQPIRGDGPKSHIEEKKGFRISLTYGLVNAYLQI